MSLTGAGMPVALLWEVSLFQQVRPAGDVANYLLWARSVADGEPVWHGYYSYVSFGHPGPLLFWVLAAGLLAARMVPWVSADVAAWVTYTAACVACVVFTVRSRTGRSGGSGT